MIAFFKKTWQRLSYLGVQDDLSISDSRRIIVSNQMILVMSLCCLPFSIVYYLAGGYFLSVMVVVSVFIALFSLVLNHWWYYFWARFWIVLWPSFVVYCYADVFGRDSGTQLVCFGIACMSLIIFDPEKRFLKGCVFLIPFFFLFVLEFTQYSVFPDIVVGDNIQLFIHVCILLVTAPIIYLSIEFYSALNVRVEKELRDSNVALQEALEESRKRRVLLEKMSQQTAFSSLSMGIAHEIRNPLAILLAQSEVLAQRPDDSEAVLTFAERIKSHIFRILRIIKIMIKYSHPSLEKKSVFQVNDVILDIVTVAEGKCLGRQIKMVSDLADLPHIYEDIAGVHQVILSLVLNAVESIPDGVSGQVSIRSRLASFQTIHGNLCSGIEIDIEDNGCGMTQAELDKACDPFYSNKYGHVGLGLSTALKYVSDMNGNIDIKTTFKAGTLVKVYLPLPTSQTT